MDLYSYLIKETDKMVYCEDMERENFSGNGYYRDRITFDTFVSLMDDYYTVEYCGKLGKTSFVVFKMFMMLARYDGFVKISYDDFIKRFCSTGLKICKTTLRKSIDELIENDLICSADTKESGTLNGCKVYGIVDKSYIIYGLCDQKIADKNADIFSLIDRYKSGYGNKKMLFHVGRSENIKQPKKQEQKKKGKRKLSDKTKYNALMRTLFKEIKSEMEEFFDFLGSYNKTGKIALSRKVKILCATKHYADEDIVYAINLTMRNTVNGKNPYRERYFLKILRNLYEEDSTDNVNDVAVELSKKAEEKLKNKKQKDKQADEDDVFYKRELERLKTVSMYWDRCISMYKNSTNTTEKKIYKIAKAIKRKFDAYDETYANVCKRERLLQTIGWHENITYDNKWNYIIEYFDDNGTKVSKDVAVRKMIELGITPQFTKYDIFS